MTEVLQMLLPCNVLTSVETSKSKWERTKGFTEGVDFICRASNCQDKDKCPLLMIASLNSYKEFKELINTPDPVSK